MVWVVVVTGAVVLTVGVVVKAEEIVVAAGTLQ